MARNQQIAPLHHSSKFIQLKKSMKESTSLLISIFSVKLRGFPPCNSVVNSSLLFVWFVVNSSKLIITENCSFLLCFGLKPVKLM